MGKIFASSGSRHSLARQASDSSRSQPRDPDEPPKLPPKVNISRNESARSSNATTTFKSIYESRMQNSARASAENVYFESNTSTVYDPSLPEELKRAVPAGLMFRDAVRPFTPPSSGPKLPEKSRGNSGRGGNSGTPPLTPGCKQPTCGGKRYDGENFNLTAAEARQLMEAAPEDRREFLYGPGGVFGPKGPFSTPIVRYIC